MSGRQTVGKRELPVYPPVFPAEPDEGRVVMGHGAGGRKMHRLIRRVFLEHFGNEALERLEDGAIVELKAGRVCVTTDSHVVQPLFFPGGDIGRLAVCGTVNDLAVMGAEPRLLTFAVVMREGLSLETLDRVCASAARAAREAGVIIVAGDTKVIEAGADEGLYINTSGVGVVPAGLRLGIEMVRPGDVILISGGVGEHEAAVGLARGSFRFKARVRSDCAPVNRLVKSALRAGGVKVMRDPTRGGLATTLNEFAEASGLGFVIDGSQVPVAKAVRGVAALLGLDPLYMANEGKVVMVVAPERADRVLGQLRRNRLGRRASRIGMVQKSPKGVWLRTDLGSLRPLIMLEAEQLPRIC
ncbi:MAG: hydrogenase expression/formation protein HypE [candidate division WOR-3 bacterium]